MTSDEVVRWKSLIEINALINSQYRDYRILLSKIMESAKQLIRTDGSSLLLMESGQLHFVVVLGEKGEEIKKYSLDEGEGIAGWVIQHNRSLIVNDVSADPRHCSRIGEDVGIQTRNLIAVPLKIKTQTLGVLEVINKTDGSDFTSDDLYFLEVLADQAAITLLNSREFGAINIELETLKKQTKLISGHVKPFIWKSPVMGQILEKLEKLASTNLPVIIFGESGTGKELIAERIHALSPRSSSPLIRINCAAIPPGLVESELFGHVKGAFTDAAFNKIGLFEQASGGTLFLDEVGELGSDVQVKLLRVLQDGCFQKVGGDKDIHTDVRILAATNKNLKEIDFRQELYYRLAVLTLKIPPLRDRHEDIETLARHFLNVHHLNNSEFPNDFTLEALDTLLTYHWPGNIRELKNAIERAVVTAWGKKCIDSGDLGLNVTYSHDKIYEGQTLKDSLNLFKKNIIEQKLKQYHGNQTRTAIALGIQRTYLSRIIRELTITYNQREFP